MAENPPVAPPNPQRRVKLPRKEHFHRELNPWRLRKKALINRWYVRAIGFVALCALVADGYCFFILPPQFDSVYKHIFSANIQGQVISALSAVILLPNAFFTYFINNKNSRHHIYPLGQLAKAAFGISTMGLLIIQICLLILVCVSLMVQIIDLRWIFTPCMSAIFVFMVAVIVENRLMHSTRILNGIAENILKQNLYFRANLIAINNKCKNVKKNKRATKSLAYINMEILDDYKRLGKDALNEFSQDDFEFGVFFEKQMDQLLTAAATIQDGFETKAHAHAQADAPDAQAEQAKTDHMAAEFNHFLYDIYCSTAKGLINDMQSPDRLEAFLRREYINFRFKPPKNANWPFILLTGIAGAAVEQLTVAELRDFIRRFENFMTVAPGLRDQIYLAMLYLAKFRERQGLRGPEFIHAMISTKRIPTKDPTWDEELKSLVDYWSERDGEHGLYEQIIGSSLT